MLEAGLPRVIVGSVSGARCLYCMENQWRERYFGSFKVHLPEIVPSSAQLVLTASQSIESDDKFFQKALFCVKTISCSLPPSLGREIHIVLVRTDPL